MIRARWATPLAALVAGIVLFGPVAWRAYETQRLASWQESPRFDGRRYVLDEDTLRVPAADEDRVAAVLARLHRWQGRARSIEDVLDGFDASGYPGSLGAVREHAAEAGFEGEWVEASLAALERFNKPLIADTRHDGGTLLIVRRVRDGYVYATAPGVGDVLYRIADFDRVWTGRALVFPDPPDQPQEWR